MTSLADLPSGARARIVAIYAGPNLRRRLLEMGLAPRTPVEIVMNNMHGPLLVRVRGVVIALGRGMARKIIVEEF